MGEQLKTTETAPEGMQKFTQLLLKDLKALEIMLADGVIESGVTRIGAEQELCLIDRHGFPAPKAVEIMEHIHDGHIVHEYARFNLEINLDPTMFRGNCFSEIGNQLDEYLAIVGRAAERHQVRALLVGILPTIRQRDLIPENMTPLPRYNALDERLQKLRGGKPFRFYINGADQLIAEHPTSLPESCNTSFQVHLQVDPATFARDYNFAQLVSGPLLAAATNSPLLFGKRLWRETRIALFQQSIDTRHIAHPLRKQSPRVTFGEAWIKDSVLEIFRDDLARFRLLITSGEEEDALAVLEQGGVPRLKALGLFNGTVYRWNRACYGLTEGKPHLRIENRVLPAGPTVTDEVANAAFWLGMMRGMPGVYPDPREWLDFDLAYSNFVEAAKTGIDTHFSWRHEKSVAARDLILEDLLPIARQGLQAMAVDEADVARYLDVLEERVRRRHTGSLWMFESFNRLIQKKTRLEAAVTLTAALAKRQAEGHPVCDWELAVVGETDWRNMFQFVEQIMTTDLYTLHEEDPVDRAAHIMNWKKIRHVPVEDEQGRLVGLVNARTLIRYLGTEYPSIKLKAVKEIMIKNPITVAPDTDTSKALEIMDQEQISCLPVVMEGKLVGIVTENDFARVFRKALQHMKQSA